MLEMATAEYLSNLGHLKRACMAKCAGQPAMAIHSGNGKNSLFSELFC